MSLRDRQNGRGTEAARQHGPAYKLEEQPRLSGMSDTRASLVAWREGAHRSTVGEAREAKCIRFHTAAAHAISARSAARWFPTRPQDRSSAATMTERLAPSFERERVSLGRSALAQVRTRAFEREWAFSLQCDAMRQGGPQSEGARARGRTPGEGGHARRSAGRNSRLQRNAFFAGG